MNHPVLFLVANLCLAFIVSVIFSSCQFSKDVPISPVTNLAEAKPQVAPLANPELPVEPQPEVSPSPDPDPSPSSQPSPIVLPKRSPEYSVEVAWANFGQTSLEWSFRKTHWLAESQPSLFSIDGAFTIPYGVPESVWLRFRLPIERNRLSLGELTVELLNVDDTGGGSRKIATSQVSVTASEIESESMVVMLVSDLKLLFGSKKEVSTRWVLVAKNAVGDPNYAVQVQLRTLPTEYTTRYLSIAEAYQEGVKLDSRTIRPSGSALRLQLAQVVSIKNFGPSTLVFSPFTEVNGSLTKKALKHLAEASQCSTAENVVAEDTVLAEGLIELPLDERLQQLLAKFETDPNSIQSTDIVVGSGDTRYLGVFLRENDKNLAQYFSHYSPRAPKTVMKPKLCHAFCKYAFNPLVQPTPGNWIPRYQNQWDSIFRVWNQYPIVSYYPRADADVQACLSCGDGNLSDCDRCRAFETPDDSIPKKLGGGDFLYCAKRTSNNPPIYEPMWTDVPESGPFLEGTEDIDLVLKADSGVSYQVRYGDQIEQQNPTYTQEAIMNDPVHIEFGMN